MMAYHSPSSSTYSSIRSATDDIRRELYNGRIFEIPSPTLAHQAIIGNLALELFIWAKKHGGRLYLSPLDLFISPRDVFIPDLSFYSKEQMAGGQVAYAHDYLTVAPFLIVEVISDLTRLNDKVRKAQAYANFHVANYWLIDPSLGTLEALELRYSRYSIVAAHQIPEIFMPRTFPDLQIDLESLFAC